MEPKTLEQILGLVQKAAYRGYVDSGAYHQLSLEFKNRVRDFVKDTEKRIAGGTLVGQMAVIRAYDFGRQAYLEKIAV